jgi:hypothetical protein
MRHVKLFEAFSTSTSLAEDQIEWLDSCTRGSWKLNHTTGLLDVDGDFNCTSKSLTDLKGIKFGEVSGGFSCGSNLLTSLEGAPQTVGINFYCHNNRLTSLEGAPQIVGSDFSCNNNLLTSLEGAPQTVGGGFYCHDNPVSGETLVSIFALMKKGKSYQQALEEHWPEMGNEDRVLMYKQMPNLPPEETRMYQALARFNRMKGYL